MNRNDGFSTWVATTIVGALLVLGITSLISLVVHLDTLDDQASMSRDVRQAAADKAVRP